MKIYLIIASGKYTGTINSVKWTANKIEILKASANHDAIMQAMSGDGPVLPNPENWGLTAISIYTAELEERA